MSARFATITVACVSAGTCGGGGDYTDAAGHGQAYVVSKEHGVWGAAEAVPGLAALNSGGSAQLYVLSCGPPDGCGGGGYYTDNAAICRRSSPPPATAAGAPP